MWGGEAGCEEEIAFLRRGGGRGGAMREGLGSCNESVCTVGLLTSTGLLSSETKGLPFLLTGSGGGRVRVSSFQAWELFVVFD